MATTAEPEHRATVIDLALVRPPRGRRSTFLLRLSAMKGDEEAYRYIGIDDASLLPDLARVIDIAFDLPASDTAPAGFTREAGEPHADTLINPESTLGDAFGAGRTTIYYNWGLWRFDIELAEVYPRDESTPRAVCVAGSGDFGFAPLHITDINRALIGDDTANDVLRLTRPEIGDIVMRSNIFDFILLLKALDLARPTDVSPQQLEVLAQLPRERTRPGQDAFWSVVLGLACLADADTTDSVISSTFAALGYGSVSAAKVRELCAGSLVRLAGLGAYGAAETAPVTRLDVFRELLRG